MTKKARQRHARIMLYVAYAQVPVAAALYWASLSHQWAKDALIPYLIALSVVTWIDSVHARRNADL